MDCKSRVNNRHHDGVLGRGDISRPSRVMGLLPFHIDVCHFPVVPDQAAVIRVPEAVDLERPHHLHHGRGQRINRF